MVKHSLKPRRGREQHGAEIAVTLPRVFLVITKNGALAAAPCL
jgi:hypothetical protein